MGFRFRKSFKIAPGIKVNVSKKGASLSAGAKGFRINSKGNASLTKGPISYHKKLFSKKKTYSSKKDDTKGLWKIIALFLLMGLLIRSCVSYF